MISPYAGLITAVLCVSFGAIFAKLSGAPALIIATYRNLLVAVFILPLVLKNREEFKKLRLYEILICFISGFFLALHFTSWIASLKYTSVASSVVLVTTHPLPVMIISSLVLKEKIPKKSLPGVILAFIGIGLIGWSDFRLAGEAFKGDLLAFLGALFMGGYILLGRSIRKKIEIWSYLFLLYGSCGSILFLTAIFIDMPLFDYPQKEWLLFITMAIVPSLMGHGLLNWCLRYLSATTVSLSILGEPVGASILAALILFEVPTFCQVIGSLFIILGLFMYLKKIKEK